MPFSKLGLSAELSKHVLAQGFVLPSDVQEKVIPLILQGKDVIGQAKTGTGKTAAFGLPLLQLVDEKEKFAQALVVVPTRELCQQVQVEIERFSHYKHVRVVSVYGGASLNVQVSQLRRGCQIVVGTPGRLMDLMRRGELRLDKTKWVVLDEADKMLDMGFIDDIQWILQQVPRERQTMLFSATMSTDIKDLAQQYMNHPVEVNLSTDTLTVEGVSQYFVSVDLKMRVSLLAHLIRANKVQKGIVFCETKRTVEWLQNQLNREGIHAEALHGNFSQKQRDQTLKHFAEGKIPVLIATNLASRGLHLEDVSHIFNFDFPQELETYVHRIGRTARQGKKGIAVTFVTNVLERRDIRRWEDMLKTEMKEIPLKQKA
ncbi:MAG: DEAD/DEAH box helicase [Candidatus Diapherotrites archaeon]